MIDLASLPRVRLAHLPTPLEPMDRVSKLLGGPRLWVKRDDCTGVSTGGNKVRKLEFVLADALAKGADAVVTAGAWQSNHSRQTAAAAAQLGLKCHLLLWNMTGFSDPAYRQNGNILLDRLHDATIHELGGPGRRNLPLSSIRKWTSTRSSSKSRGLARTRSRWAPPIPSAP